MNFTTFEQRRVIALSKQIEGLAEDNKLLLEIIKLQEIQLQEVYRREKELKNEIIGYKDLLESEGYNFSENEDVA